MARQLQGVRGRCEAPQHAAHAQREGVAVAGLRGAQGTATSEALEWLEENQSGDKVCRLGEGRHLRRHERGRPSLSLK